MRPFTVLGIETSCDETAAAVVRGRPPGPGTILSNVVLSQLEAHRPYGGVVPEIAARAHVERVDGIVERALSDAAVALEDGDAVAETAGPGLIGGVMVGLTTAKALALVAKKPLIAVNHLEAHALTQRLTGGVRFPFLLLLISGGHTQLMAAEGVGRYQMLGATMDDAVGEAFDKTAKLLGLPYPGGPQVEVLAIQGSPKAFPLPRPMIGRDRADFSFSGLKTAVRQRVKDATSPRGRADLAASFQAAVVDVIEDRVGLAMEGFRAMYGNGGVDFVASGGVAANRAIRAALQRVTAVNGFRLVLPPPDLCTDNAAMVAWAGLERLALGLTDSLDAPPLARWPLESLAKIRTDAGRPAEVPAG